MFDILVFVSCVCCVQCTKEQTVTSGFVDVSTETEVVLQLSQLCNVVQRL